MITDSAKYVLRILVKYALKITSEIDSESKPFIIITVLFCTREIRCDCNTMDSFVKREGAAIHR